MQSIKPTKKQFLCDPNVNNKPFGFNPKTGIHTEERRLSPLSLLFSKFTQFVGCPTHPSYENAEHGKEFQTLCKPWDHENNQPGKYYWGTGVKASLPDHIPYKTIPPNERTGKRTISFEGKGRPSCGQSAGGTK